MIYNLDDFFVKLSKYESKITNEYEMPTKQNIIGIIYQPNEDDTRKKR